MKLYKCDICGKAVERPSEIMHTYSQFFGYPNKIEMLVVDEDGSPSTKLSFDLCEDCSKKLYSSLKALKNTDDFWFFKHGEATNEPANKPDA